MFGIGVVRARVMTAMTAAAVASVFLVVVTAPADSVTNGPVAVVVQAQAAAGSAAPGNSSPADILVLVTDRVTGSAITDLAKSRFAVINHFSHPGQTCGFSNNVVTFNNVGTGAYHLQVAPASCTWAAGDFLLQVIVSSGVRHGQAAAKLSVLSRY